MFLDMQRSYVQGAVSPAHPSCYSCVDHPWAPVVEIVDICFRVFLALPKTVPTSLKKLHRGYVLLL